MPGSWSYDPTALAGSQLYQVRFMVGDTLTNDQQFFDEEINFQLSLGGSIYSVGADLCQKLAAKYSREVDLVQGELKTNYSNKATAYLRQAQVLRALAAIRGGGLPVGGGLSQSDKQAQVANSDRVVPSFNIGMQDNYLPVSPAGNEVPGSNPSPEPTGE